MSLQNEFEAIVAKLISGSASLLVYPLAKGVLTVTITDGSPDIALNDQYTMQVNGNTGYERRAVPTVDAAVAAKENVGAASIAATIAGRWPTEVITFVCTYAGATGKFKAKGSKSGPLKCIVKSATAAPASDEILIGGGAHSVLWEPIDQDDVIIQALKQDNSTKALSDIRSSIVIVNGYGVTVTGALGASNLLQILYADRSAG